MLENVFSPITISNVTLKNRFVTSPMVSNFCNLDGTATDRFLAYYEEKAKGGFGLITIEDYVIDPAGKGFPFVPGLWCDEQIESHKALPERIHKYGAKVIAQIYHCGRETSSRVIGQTPFAPSALPDTTDVEVPVELTTEQVEKLVQQFGDTALRAKKCGFDGVQVHGGHGYLIAQFLSPYSNKRTDKYGGSFMNRMRFALEIIDNIREKCGPDYWIDFRISGDEQVPGGRTIEDTKAMAMVLEEAGINSINVTVGVYDSARAVIPSFHARHGVITDYADQVRKVVSIPVTTVCRINNPFIADSIIKSGKADLVAMGRQSLCDPHTPNKAKEGRFEDIRTCLACNYGCVNQCFLGRPISCVLNPSLGNEYLENDEPAAVSKNVAIIGGGPAGMQAAINAAKKGHTVTLWEKSDQLGGQFRLAAYPPGKGEIAAFIVWEKTQLEKLGVKVNLGVEATPENIGKPDVVILACGAKPVVPPIKGLDSKMVVSYNDVLEGRAFPPGQVVVIGGGLVGVETADYIAKLRRKVTIVEMLDDVATDLARTTRFNLLAGLKEYGVTIMTSTTVEEITETGVKTTTGAEIPAGMVVLAAGRKSDPAVAEQFKAAGFEVIAIGDADTEGNVLGATKSAYEAVRSL